MEISPDIISQFTTICSREVLDLDEVFRFIKSCKPEELVQLYTVFHQAPISLLFKVELDFRIGIVSEWEIFRGDTVEADIGLSVRLNPKVYGRTVAVSITRPNLTRNGGFGDGYRK